MRRGIVLLALGGALSLVQVSSATAGIDPMPFYTEFANITRIQPRLTTIGTSYSGLRDVSLLVSSRLQDIRDGTSLKPWVTESLRIQILGTIDHISTVLTAAENAPSAADAERIMAIAERISRAPIQLVDPHDFAPQALRALAHVSPGLGWDNRILHPGPARAASFDIMMRISAVLFAPQPEPPGVFGLGLDAMDRISAVLFAPQPEPPGAPFTRALDVMDRVSSVLGAPPAAAPEVETCSLDIMDRISAVLFAPQPEPPGRSFSQAVDVMDRVSAVLFAPQPEPPGLGQRLDIIDRISAVLFAPQPEPPGLPTPFVTEAVSVLDNLAGVTTSLALDGASGNVPGLTALGVLSNHLVAANSSGKKSVAQAQLGAMSGITQQYAGY